MAEKIKYNSVEPLTLEGSERPLTQIVRKINELVDLVNEFEIKKK